MVARDLELITVSDQSVAVTWTSAAADAIRRAGRSGHRTRTRTGCSRKPLPLVHSDATPTAFQLSAQRTQLSEVVAGLVDVSADLREISRGIHPAILSKGGLGREYARASGIHIHARTEGPHLHLAVRDDGVGGADPTEGSGLIGLTDRVEALGGHLQITSHPGCGTTLIVRIPIIESPTTS